MTVPPGPLAGSDALEILERAPDAIGFVDHAWRLRFINAEAERALRRPRAEVLGQVLWDVFPRWAATPQRRRLEEAFARGEPIEFEHESATLGGWYLFRAQPRVGGLVLHAIDVSARKAAELVVREQKEQLQAVVDTIGDAVLVGSFDADLFVRNPAAVALFGLDREPDRGVDHWPAQYGMYRDEGQTPFPVAQLPLVRAMRGEATDDVPMFVRPPGAAAGRWVEVSGRPLRQADGTTYGGVAVCRDVTDRRRTEERRRWERGLLELLARDTPLAQVLHQIVRFIETQQPSLRASILLVADSGDHFEIGAAPSLPVAYSASVHRLPLTPDGSPCSAALVAREPVESRDLTNDPRWPGIHETARASGLHACWSIPVYSRDRQVIGTFAVYAGEPDPPVAPDPEVMQTAAYLAGIAIERDRAEQEKLRLEGQVLQAQKLESLGVLAGGIAHDFNNLLVGILGNARLGLLELDPSHPVHELLVDVERAGQRAADLTRQLLAYSGRGRFVIEPVDLSELVTEILALVRATVSRRAVVHTRCMPDLPTIDADATQVRQVVMNLITNASDALGDQPGEIEIATGVADHDGTLPAGATGVPAPGRYVFVEVRDSGCGMDEATRTRMFDPFFSTKFTGRGLGLAATLGIVRGHRGAIEVHSTPGEGTTVRVLLPVGSGQRPVRRTTPVPGEMWQGTGTVLVVDDDDAVRSVARRVLERAGFRVLEARDGREGVAAFEAARDAITACLVDLTMPVMDGEQALRRIRAIDAGARVVLMSGFSKQEAARRFGDGLSAFVQKPFGADELLRAVQVALGRR